MKITQVFRSAGDDRLISEIELGGANPATPIPIPGDDIRWVVDDKVYEGRVKSRLISYSPPDKVELERLNAVDITAVLRIELVKG